MNTTTEIKKSIIWLVAENDGDMADVHDLLGHIAADRLNDPAALHPDWLAGYGAYHRGLGPGWGKLRSLGWLAAAKDLGQDLAERRGW